MMFGMQYVCVVLTLSINVHARIKPAEDISPKTGVNTYPGKIIEYLKSYGYLTEDDVNKSGSVSEGLSKFQSFMGIIPNGHLNEVTRNLIKSPRCGERDIYPDKSKQVSLVKTILKQKVLRYKIKKWTKWIPRTIQNQTIFNMLRLWADDIPVKCRWSENKTEVDIIFKPDEEKTRGRASYSVYTEVKFVKNMFRIYFYSNAAQSVNALSRASAHAFGHIFGHGHSNLYSIMSPVLFRQNIKMISNDQCEISITTTFSYLSTGISYFVKGPLVWSIKEGYALNSPAKRLSDFWKGLPNEIDEAFSWGNNYRTYMFKGTQYYRYNHTMNRVDDGYPFPISRGWHGIPDYIDAVFSDRNAKTYFFKGDKTYLYDDHNHRVHPDFPKPIKDVFKGIPNHIDSVFRYYYDDVVYFFKGLYYWIWNVHKNQADGPYVIKFDWKNLCIDDH